MSKADRIRGHAFLPGGVASAIPALYATEDTPLERKTVWVRYFCGRCEWLVMEYDPAEGRAFGWADLGDPLNAELGYFSLPELRELLVVAHGLPLVVERDLDWSPRAFSRSAGDGGR